jgi:hypothetical protein
MKRFAFFLALAALLTLGLWLLRGTNNLGLSAQESPAKGQGDLEAARADYERGNQDLQQSRQPDGSANVERLAGAADSFRACLTKEGTVKDSGSLFKDARHNLELTKLLLAQAGRPDLAGTDPAPPPDAQKQAEASAQANASNQSPGRPKEPEPDCCPT